MAVTPPCNLRGLICPRGAEFYNLPQLSSCITRSRSEHLLGVA